jgi:hypothetical protein
MQSSLLEEVIKGIIFFSNIVTHPFYTIKESAAPIMVTFK